MIEQALGTTDMSGTEPPPIGGEKISMDEAWERSRENVKKSMESLKADNEAYMASHPELPPEIVQKINYEEAIDKEAEILVKAMVRKGLVEENSSDEPSF